MISCRSLNMELFRRTANSLGLLKRCNTSKGNTESCQEKNGPLTRTYLEMAHRAAQTARAPSPGIEWAGLHIGTSLSETTSLCEGGLVIAGYFTAVANDVAISPASSSGSVGSALRRALTRKGY